MDCLFCQIIEKKVPSKVLFEDDDVLAFHDISPKAPIHVLIIPKKHIRSLNDLDKSDEGLMGKIILTAKVLAEKMHISKNGYRLVMNCEKHGGQTVFHIHCHLFAGRYMHWPPG